MSDVCRLCLLFGTMQKMKKQDNRGTKKQGANKKALANDDGPCYFAVAMNFTVGPFSFF